jgi:DNA invertase Pin-like site-specific DNA recombinase
MTITVHSYGRFSDKSQEKGSSFHRQKALLDAFLASGDYRLSDLQPFDAGKSGFSGDKQKALNEFLEIMRKKDSPIKSGDILFVENIDRLSRKGVRPTQDTVNEILNHGVSIAISMPMSKIYDAKNKNDVSGAVELATLAFAAHIYSENLSRRVKGFYTGARAVAHESGRAIRSGSPPAWLTRDKNGVFEFVPGAKEAIKYIYTRTIDGIGGKRLTRELNEKFPCFGYSGRWNERYMRAILNDRRAMGECQCHEMQWVKDKPKRKKNKKKDNEDSSSWKRVPIGDPIPDYYPAAVTEDEWRLANAAAANRRVERGPTTQYVNLFTGIIFHAVDKCPCHIYTFQQKRADGRKIIYRRVKSHAASQNLKGASTPTVYANDFEVAVVRHLKELDTSIFDGTGSQIAELNAIQNELERKENRIADIEADEEGSVALLSKQLAKLNGEVAALKTKIDSLKTSMANTTAQNADHLKVLAEHEDTPENRQLLREAIKRVVSRIVILPVKLGSLRRSSVGAMIEIEYKNGHRKRLMMLGKSSGFPYMDKEPETKSLMDHTPKEMARRIKAVRDALEYLERLPALKIEKVA